MSKEDIDSIAQERKTVRGARTMQEEMLSCQDFDSEERAADFRQRFPGAVPYLKERAEFTPPTGEERRRMVAEAEAAKKRGPAQNSTVSKLPPRNMIRYPCGCVASGDGELPETCPTHSVKS